MLAFYYKIPLNPPLRLANDIVTYGKNINWTCVIKDTSPIYI